jgi:hypothetical protein
VAWRTLPAGQNKSKANGRRSVYPAIIEGKVISRKCAIPTMDENISCGGCGTDGALAISEPNTMITI